MALRPAAMVATAVFLVAAALVLSGCSPGKDLTPNGTWTPIGKKSVSSLTGAEGVATRADGSLVLRGPATIPVAVRTEGFNHIGDLDIARGDLFDAYQGLRKTSAKLFLVTKADGKRVEYRHPLDPGELFNTSFVTVSPDAQWLVSGEFGTQRRLQVFPAPLLNSSTPPNGGTLKQAGQITLDTPVTDIQGCDFFSAQRLVCTSDDKAKHVFRVDLPRALDGKPITGEVTNLFTLPKTSRCSGTYEAEGVDYDADTKTLRAAILSPGVCKATTVIFSYRWTPE